MASKDLRERPDERPPETLTLVDAIQQTLKTREMLTEMQARMKSLEKQRGHARQKVIRDVTEAEIETLRNSIRTFASQADRMAQFFTTMRIVVNGRPMTAETALKILISLKQHADGLANLTKSFEIETLDNPKLALAYEQAKDRIENCVSVWRDELVAFAMILETVKIPDSVSDLFLSVWLERGTVVSVYVEWSREKRKWVPVSGTEVSDERLKQYIADASTLSAVEDLPDKYEARIECVTDDQGNVTFRIKTRSPYGSGHSGTGGPGSSGHASARGTYVGTGWNAWGGSGGTGGNSGTGDSGGRW